MCQTVEFFNDDKILFKNACDDLQIVFDEKTRNEEI
jgi:hypothetical protein